MFRSLAESERSSCATVLDELREHLRIRALAEETSA